MRFFVFEEIKTTKNIYKTLAEANGRDSYKTLAEANGRDSYFAIGLPLTHPDVLDPTKWADNSNHLGRILMEIREELRSAS